jgi:hypothetical protein
MFVADVTSTRTTYLSVACPPRACATPTAVPARSTAPPWPPPLNSPSHAPPVPFDHPKRFPRTRSSLCRRPLTGVTPSSPESQPAAAATVVRPCRSCRRADQPLQSPLGEHLGGLAAFVGQDRPAIAAGEPTRRREGRSARIGVFPGTLV